MSILTIMVAIIMILGGVIIISREETNQNTPLGCIPVGMHPSGGCRMIHECLDGDELINITVCEPDNSSMVVIRKDCDGGYTTETPECRTNQNPKGYILLGIGVGFILAIIIACFCGVKLLD